MEICVLGSLRVVSSGQVIEISAPKQRTLLGVLVLERNRAVSADRLLEEMWGDAQPSSGVKALRYHVSMLRDALSPDRAKGDMGGLNKEAGGYVLRIEEDAIDAVRFEQLAATGAELVAEGRHDEARCALAEALKLWRGDALADFRYEMWAQPEIARLEERRLLCVEDRITAEVELGLHLETLPELRELTTTHPMREALWGLLMVALYRSDQQAEALRAYEMARAVLGEELGVEPNAALQRLERAISTHELPFEAPERLIPPRHNLPARIASFVGRSHALAELEVLQNAHRLVTLIGIGGIGKTSLALEFGRRRIDEHRNGVWLVELASLTDPGSVVGAIARSLGIDDHPTRRLSDVIVSELAEKEMLILIDNCEHLLDEVARVVETLLRGCRDLRVLATSRMPLGVVGEQTYRVLPFDVPSEREAAASPTFAQSSDAIQLLLDRARESQPSFELDSANTDAVVTICRRLDGIPLAIELAAARLRVFSPSELVERLSQRLEVLTGGGDARPARHETLATAFDWSYRLLRPGEKRLLPRLAVFEGGFTLVAVESTCCFDGIERARIPDLLGALVDASFVQFTSGAQTRFTILESVRDYLRDRLDHAGESEQMHRLHATYFSGLFPDHPAFDSAAHAEMLAELAIEESNLRSAMSWSVEEAEGALALCLGAALAELWFFNARIDEWMYWAPRVLEIAETSPSRERVRVSYFLASALTRSGDRARGLQLFEEVRAAASSLSDPVSGNMAALAQFHENFTDGHIRAARDALDAHIQTMSPADPQLSLMLTWIAASDLLLGELDDVSETVGRIVALGAVRSQPMIGGFAVEVGARVALMRGDLHVARRLHLEALADLRRLDRQSVEGGCYLGLAQIAVAMGDLNEASVWADKLVGLGRRNFDGDEIALGYGLSALVALRKRRLIEARDWLVQAIDVASRAAPLAVEFVLDVAAEYAHGEENLDEAVRLHSRSSVLRTELELFDQPWRGDERRRALNQLRAALGPTDFEKAWVDGAAMDLAVAIADARRT